MSTSQLTSAVPAHWASAVRPFLQRADEFQSREPLVSYFLRTHAAFVCMQRRTKDDKEGTKYLMLLLDALEEDKKVLGDQLDGVSGRTVLTKIALMLFAKADDEERSGHASMSVVRLFYSAAVLFEATEQFTSDNKMDSVAAEKCRYARYTAAKMKKALDNHEPYTSANPLEAPVTGPVDNTHNNNNSDSVASTKTGQRTPSLSPAPSTMPPPPPPVAVETNEMGSPPSYTQSNRPLPPPPPQNQQQQQQQLQPQPQKQQQQQQCYVPPANSYSPSSASGHTPTPEEMIEAQKFARQAVSALQFYDHATARVQLLSALSVLDGKKK